MKRFFKKTALVILLFVLLAINLLVIADSSQTFVNLGASLKFSSTKTEVKTGEEHKVTIKSAYADPNDENDAVYRVYLKDKDGNPNQNVQILNLKDNLITYEDINGLGDVEVRLIEEKDNSGKVTNKYLEYRLQPGMTVLMEIEFFVPVGKIREEKLILSGVISYEEREDTKKEETQSEVTPSPKVTETPIVTFGSINPAKRGILNNQEIKSGVPNNNEEGVTSGEKIEEVGSGEKVENEEIDVINSGEELDEKDEEIKDEEVKNEEVKDKEVKDEEVKDEEIEDEEVKDEEVKDEETKNEEVKDEEIKDEEVKDEEVKDEEVKDEETKDEEVKDEEVKNEETKDEEAENEVEKENVLAQFLNKFLGSIAIAISNEKIDEDLELTWKGEFKYGPLQVAPISSIIKLVEDTIDSDVEFLYSLESNNGVAGSIFAKSLKSDILLNTHDILPIPDNAYYDGNGTICYEDGTPIIEIKIAEYTGYTLNVELKGDNKVEIHLSIENDSPDAEDVSDVINGLAIKLHTAEIVIPSEKISTVKAQSIENITSVEAKAYDDETKVLQENALVSFDNNPSGIIIKKGVYGGSNVGVTYNVFIKNESTKSRTSVFKDEMFGPQKLDSLSKEKLEKAGYTVTTGESGDIIEKLITLEPYQEMELRYSCTYDEGISDEDICSNKARFYDAEDELRLCKKSFVDANTLLLEKTVKSRVKGFRYLPLLQQYNPPKIKTGNDLYKIEAGDLIEYLITVENTKDYDIFITHMDDYSFSRGFGMGDGYYVAPSENFTGYRLDLATDNKNDILNKAISYRNNASPNQGIYYGSHSAPVYFERVMVPAKTKLEQTMAFLVPRDTRYVNRDQSFMYFQLGMGSNQPLDQEGYFDIESKVKIDNLSSSVFLKAMDLKYYRDNYIKLDIEVEKRYVNYLLGGKEVIYKGSGDVNYVSPGDLIEYTFKITNLGDEYYDYTLSLFDSLLAVLRPASNVSGVTNGYIALYNADAIKAYNIQTNEYNELSEFTKFEKAGGGALYVKEGKYPAKTTLKQTLVEVVDITRKNGASSYANFYSDMKSSLSRSVGYTLFDNGDLYASEFEMTHINNYNKISREVKVKAPKELEEQIEYDIKVVGKYPNYLNDSSSQRVFWRR